jgi:hypothetical protein
MAGWQTERGNCNGNGWTGTGFCKKLKDFMTATYAGGGANWYVWDDRSELGADPYIVFCDTAAPVVNDHNTGPTGGPPKFIRVVTFSAMANSVTFEKYFYWDNSAHAQPSPPSGGTASYWSQNSVYTVAGDFSYDFRGGAAGYVIHSYVSGSWYGTGWVDSELITSNLGCTDVVDPVSSMTGSGATRTINVVDGSKFVAGCRYMIYDFSASPYLAEMVVVNSIATNALSVTVSNTNTPNFSSTAKIGTYPHKWISFSGFHSSTGYHATSYGIIIPYVYAQAGQTTNRTFYDGGSSIYTRVSSVFVQSAATVTASTSNSIQSPTGIYLPAYPSIVAPQFGPNNSGSPYPLQFPWFKIKCLLIYYNTTHFAGQDGITVNGQNFLYLGNNNSSTTGNQSSTMISDCSSDYRMYWLDTESTS